MPELHALLSPSASSRWLVCTPSAAAERGEPSRDTVFTREGTLAHLMAETTLNEMLGKATAGDNMKVDQQVLEEGFDLDEMDRCMGGAVQTVWQYYADTRSADAGTVIMPEVQVSVEDYAKDCWGTSDVVIVGNGTVHVIDYKYGKGVKVDAYNNTQMMIYALGAYLMFGYIQDIENVKMTIIQPRLDHISTYDMGIRSLLSWAEGVLRPQALLAGSGMGKPVPGVHCRFCRMAGKCRAFADHVDHIMSGTPPVVTLSEEGLSQALRSLPVVRNWINAVEGSAMERMMGGGRIRGWKVVEGRSMTKVTDEKGLLKALLGKGFRKGDLYREPELKGITDLRKLVGKEFGEVAAPYVTRTPGKPTIAEESDKREQITTAAMAAQMFD